MVGATVSGGAPVKTFDEIAQEVDRLYQWHFAIAYQEIDKPQRVKEKIDAIAKYWVDKMEAII